MEGGTWKEARIFESEGGDATAMPSSVSAHFCFDEGVSGLNATVRGVCLVGKDFREPCYKVEMCHRKTAIFYSFRVTEKQG